MAKIRITLDKRKKNARGEHPIYIMIYHNSSNTMVATGAYCDEKSFDANDPMHVLTPKTPNARLMNMQIYELYSDVVRFVFELDKSGKLKHMTCSDVRKAFEKRNDDDEQNTQQSFTQYIKQMRNAQRTSSQKMFDYTIKWIDKFNSDELAFSDIDYSFLKAFDTFMQRNGLGANTRGIIFRNIRTAINQAINDELTENYPFRKFRIPHVQKDKEYLRIEDFRKLLAFQPATDGQQAAKDLFLLSFFFCGANPIDIFNMPKDINGYIKFIRTKTKAKTQGYITLKVQQEAVEIIDRNKGKHTLLDFSERYLNYDNFYHFVSKRLRAIAKILDIQGLSFYYARYSWATYASRIGIDESVIGRALGHAPSSLAGKVYITFDWERVDDANRQVIDYLLHG